MTGPDTLKQFEGPLKTKMGKAFPGTRAVFRGVDLHSTFKDATWMDLHVYSITGKRLQANQLRVLEGLCTCTSYPDPRLWNNRIAALAGSARSTGRAGLTGAMAVADASIYCGIVEITVADFLVRAYQQISAGGHLENFLQEERTRTKIIKGFGRPVATKDVDERIPFTLDLLKRENVEIGEHFKLAFDIERTLTKVLGRELPMTYSTALMAVPLDFGFAVQECYLFANIATYLGMTPGYLEALERPEGATFVMRCERLQYDGPSHRKWK
jgi:hypothetical protein